jgi:hypothetical protein
MHFDDTAPPKCAGYGIRPLPIGSGTNARASGIGPPRSLKVAIGGHQTFGRKRYAFANDAVHEHLTSERTE